MTAARITLLAACCLLASLAPAAGAADPACADGVPGGRAVAVSGLRLQDLHGERVSRLRAWALRAGKRVAIPFQVDECSADGRVALTGNRDPSTLEDRSVVVFRRTDAGERMAAPAPGAFEIEIVSRGAGDARWLYLGRAPDLAASGEDLVDYEPEHDRVRAERYTLAFESPQAGYFSLADGKGRERGNLLDRLKARVRAHFLAGLVSFRRNETQVKETLVGYRDGPIRVIRRVSLHVDIGWGFPSPEILVDDYFYADHAEGPVYVSLPFPLAYVFGDLDVEIYLDFRDLDGFEVAADGLDGRRLRVGDRERILPDTSAPQTSWFMLIGPGDAALLHRLRFGPSLLGLDSRLLYIDDPTFQDPPEAVPGLRPAIGYRLTGWSSVGRGQHEVWMDTYVVNRETAAVDPAAVVRGLSIPARVRVEQLR